VDTAELQQRIERNRALMREPKFRRGLLLLVPMFYAITVAARVLEGVRLPDALWDLGPHGFTLLTASSYVVLLALAHRRWSHLI